MRMTGTTFEVQENRKITHTALFSTGFSVSQILFIKMDFACPSFLTDQN